MTAPAPWQAVEQTEPTGTLCATPARSTRPRFLLLIADAEPALVNDLARQLTEHQIDVVTCHDAVDALLRAGILLPDAVLTAAAVPPVSGSAIARALHARTCVPIVVGVGDTDGTEATAALAAGATACIRRPYRMTEILPLLRSMRSDTAAAFGPPVVVGALRLDPATMQVHLGDRPLRLPLREFQLLHLLMNHAGRVVTRQQIVRLIWGGEDASNSVNVHIRRIRAHLGDDPQRPRTIVTVRGMGYRLDPPPARRTSRP